MAHIRLLVFALLAACGEEDGGDDRPRPGKHNQNGGEEGGGEEGGGPSEPEADCTDGLDDDEDGAADCLDDDCAAEFQCTWPDTIRHDSQVDFVGNEIECWWQEKQVPNCTTRFTSDLVAMEAGDLCPTCDRTYAGAITYQQDTCQELVGGPRPTEESFGLVFLSEDQRELWAKDVNGQWQLSLTLTRQQGQWAFSETTPIEDDLDEYDCPEGTQVIGTLTVSMSFTDL